MFIVTCCSPVDEEWEDRDLIIIKAASRKSDYNAAGFEKGFGSERVHGWYVTTIGEARQLARELNKIEGVTAEWRER